MPTTSTSNSPTDAADERLGPEWHERGHFPVEGPPAWEPTHPGEMLREVLEEGLRLSVAEAARRLRLSRQTLHAILAGRQAVTADVALRLERLGAGRARFWMDMQVGYDLETSRVKLAAGRHRKGDTSVIKPVTVEEARRHVEQYRALAHSAATRAEEERKLAEEAKARGDEVVERMWLDLVASSMRVAEAINKECDDALKRLPSS